MSTMGIRFYRGSIVNVLKGYFPDIPRTKKGAYKYLKARGYYPEDKQPATILTVALISHCDIMFKY